MAEPTPQAAPDQPPTKTEPEPRKGRVTEFMTSLGGLLTAVATLITAGVGIWALLPHRDSPAGAATTAAAAAPAPAGSDARAGQGSAPGASDGVARSGSLRLGRDEFVNLAGGVVSNSRDGTSDFYLDALPTGYQLTAAILQHFAAGTNATKADCVSALSTRADNTADLSKQSVGSVLCLTISDDRVAALTFTALPSVGSPAVAFDYVLWN